jgi:protease-4
MNQLRTILLGLWRGLDVLRKLLHLIVLLVIFGFVFGALRGSAPVIPSRAALLLAPEGELVEQLSGDPLQRALEQARGDNHAETLLWDLTASIRAAAKDRRVPVIAIDVDKLDGAGQPMLEELARALKEFKTSGKKVIAYGNELSQARYYLAAQADEIYLDPMGYILIEGYERYQWYYKQALEKLGIDINVFRVGQYKSAVEPYLRNDMSPEDREESLAYLKAEWTSYQDAVTRARRLPADSLARYVGSLSKTMTAARGDAAQVALQAGLITGIKTHIEFERRIIDLVGEDETSGSFKSVSTGDYARVVRAESRVSATGKPRIGVIVASGEVLDGEQPPGTIGGDSTSRLIRQARMDRNVRAVVLRVNSPGGSVQASEEIYRELVALRAAGKPLVVSMSDLAASGGYYISAPADEIWASPATITGSIGIFTVVPTIDKTLSKLGVSVDGVGTTPLSGELRLDRPLGEPSRAWLQSQIDRGYDVFLSRVSSGRKKTPEQIDSIAHGRVWAGRAAHEIGLVDQLGSFDDAVGAAAKRANLHDYAVEFVEPELTWAQELMQQLRSSTVRALLKADRESAALARVASTLDPLTREMERLSRFTQRNHLYAYCFCSVE